MLLTAVLFSAITSLATASPPQPRQQLCNGNADFCNRVYSNVSLIGTHDSAFVGSIDDPRVNQEKSVAEQLDAGIRFLQAQTHELFDVKKRDIDFGDVVDEIGDSVEEGLSGIYMCHTSCALLNAGRLEDYLGTVKTWLDAHPDEVVTMLLVNGDNVDVSDFDTAFQESGLSDVAFVPATSPAQLAMEDWPTYGDLLSDGKRLVLFLDAEADEAKVPYILDEFTYFFETPYDTTDPAFGQCTLDRPSGGSPDGRMMLVNHFLDKELLGGILIPDNDADFTTNAATGDGSIGAQADLCTSTYGRVPNVVLVDMFDRGDVLTAQSTLNGV